MDTQNTAAYAWRVPETEAIRMWVTSGKPCLGICLGHPLLAEAMGAAHDRPAKSAFNRVRCDCHRALSMHLSDPEGLIS